MKKLAVISLSLLLVGTAASAQQVSDFDAMVEVLRGSVSEKGMPTYKIESASTFRKPYRPDDTRWEKAARTAWYAAQLPLGFPGSGTVSVFYLARCASSPNDFDLLNGEGDSDKLRRALDSAILLNALAVKAVTDITPAGLYDRSYGNPWARNAPDPSLRAFNSELQGRFETGKLKERIAVFEPFCPNSQRGTYEQRYELWETGGREGPPPLPDIQVYPPPPPVMTSAPPIKFKRPLNVKVLVASEFRSRLCEVKTGYEYHQSCNWIEMLGTGMTLTGRYYRFRIEPSVGPPRGGRIDLHKQPAPIDLTQ